MSRHEELYRRTIDNFISSVRGGEFTEAAVPGMIHDLRQELGQCIELNLIGEEFYAERMAMLSETVELVEA